MDGPEGSGPRAVTLAAAGVQATAVLTIVWIGSVPDGLGLDPWRPAAIGALYLVPAVLAVLSVRGRQPLLLVAAVTSLVLAVVGFSVHSLVFLPVAVAYLVAHVRGRPRGGRVRVAPLLVCPALALAALAVQFVHEDPACYARHASGDVAVDRSPGDVTTGSGSGTAGSGTAGSDIVERGCTSDTVVGWEAASSMGLSGLAVAAGLVSPPRRP